LPYKVLLVDDEEIITDGLSSVFPWHKYDCKVVAAAEDGTEGLELIRVHKPDIIITDICMPEMDGLTMVAGLKSEFPDIQITVLTGFRDFEYARRAIALGVARFLLKPSKMVELEEAVGYMTGCLKKSAPLPEPEASEGEKTEEQESPHNFLLSNAQKFITEHYAEKISLKDVADSVYVSQWHLSKLISKYMEKSFFDLLNEARIDVAKKLLGDPSLRISDISEMVGYSEMPHFARVFKKVTGVSANVYRNKTLE